MGFKITQTGDSIIIESTGNMEVKQSSNKKGLTITDNFESASKSKDTYGYLKEHSISMKKLNKMNDTEVIQELESLGFNFNESIWTEDVKRTRVYRQFVKEEGKD